MRLILPTKRLLRILEAIRETYARRSSGHVLWPAAQSQTQDRGRAAAVALRAGLANACNGGLLSPLMMRCWSASTKE